MLPFTGFINTTNNFDFALHAIKPEHGLKLMAILWLIFIVKGALDSGNQSLTAAQFPVSAQKPCYDFNFKKRYFKTNCL